MKTARPLLIAALGLALLSACSQAPESLQGGLEPQFGKAGYDWATEVAANAAHPYVFVAGTYAGGDEDRVFIREYNKDGRFIWERLLPDFVGYEYAESIGTDAAGNAYLIYLGDSYPDPYEDVYERYLVKFDKRGKQIWRKTLSSNSSGSLAVDNKGNIWVTSNENGVLLQKYASDGRIIYESDFIPRFSIGHLAVSDTNDLYAEITDFRNCNEDVYAYCDFQRGLRKYAANGQIKFDRVVSGSYKSIDGLAFGNNSVYVAYISEGSPGLPIYVKKYSESGRLLSKRTIATGAEDYTLVRGVSADNDGNLYLSGAISSDNPDSSNSYPFKDDVFVSKYSPSLASKWTYRTDLLGTGGIAWNVTSRTTGEIYAVGSSDGKINGKNSGSSDAFLIRLNSKGQKVWIR